jgi:hypothetical protein
MLPVTSIARSLPPRILRVVFFAPHDPQASRTTDPQLQTSSARTRIGARAVFA